MPLLAAEPAAAPLMLPAPHRVTARTRETADTWTLALEPCDGARVPFAPGQFTMLSAGGAGEVPVSISGDPADAGRLVQTVRAVGLATQAICAAEPGRVLGVRGPYGRGWPLDLPAGTDVVVVAGGIGLAPLRPAVLELLGRRATGGRVVLLYGGRAPDQLLFGAELDRWRARGAEVAVIVDVAGPAWRGPVGVVTRLVQRCALDPARTVALLCGPEVMMRFAATALLDRGVGAGRIHVSMERNMQCGMGRCGHCQLGPFLLCRDGPVHPWEVLEPWLAIPEL